MVDPRIFIYDDEPDERYVPKYDRDPTHFPGEDPETLEGNRPDEAEATYGDREPDPNDYN